MSCVLQLGSWASSSHVLRGLRLAWVVLGLEINISAATIPQTHIHQTKAISSELQGDSLHVKGQHLQCEWWSNIWGRKKQTKSSFERTRNSGNACYPSVQSLLTSRLLSKNVKITKTNSVVWVRERTIPTERPQHVGEVSANFFCG
jgi:hypothetical protein